MGGRVGLRQDSRKWECARARANLNDRDLMVERKRTRKSMRGKELSSRLLEHR